MRSSRDTYGFKSLRINAVRFVPGKNCDQCRRVLVAYVRRHPDVRRKVFEWGDETGGIVVRRVM